MTQLQLSENHDGSLKELFLNTFFGKSDGVLLHTFNEKVPPIWIAFVHVITGLLGYHACNFLHLCINNRM